MKKRHPHSAEAVMDRCENGITEIRTLAYLLLADVESALDMKRGSVDGETVTLKFQKEGIHATSWLTGKIWNDLVDLDNFLSAARDAQTEAEENGRTLA